LHSRRKKGRRSPRLIALCLAVIAAAGGLALWGWRVHTRLPGTGVQLPDYVTQDYLTVNPYSRPGTELKKIHGVVIHYVGNPGTAAEANRNYFESLADGKDGVYASAHFIVGLEGEVIQCIPLTEESYASNSRNADTISIEVCHPDSTGKFSDVTYQRVVELTAWLCREFHLDPETDVIRHYDVTGKECPKYYVDYPDAWDQLRADVKAEMDQQETAEQGS